MSECSPDIEDYRPHDEREHGEEEHSEPRSGQQAVLQRAAAHRDLSDFTSRLQSWMHDYLWQYSFHFTQLGRSSLAEKVLKHLFCSRSIIIC